MNINDIKNLGMSIKNSFIVNANNYINNENYVLHNMYNNVEVSNILFNSDENMLIVEATVQRDIIINNKNIDKSSIPSIYKNNLQNNLNNILDKDDNITHILRIETNIDVFYQVYNDRYAVFSEVAYLSEKVNAIKMHKAEYNENLTKKLKNVMTDYGFSNNEANNLIETDKNRLFDDVYIAQIIDEEQALTTKNVRPQRCMASRR